MHGQDNLTQNIFKLIESGISENSYTPKHKFFQKRATDCCLQRIFYSYIDSTGNQSFFNKLKQIFKKENYFRLKNFETPGAISRLRLPSHTLAIVSDNCTI